MNSETGLKFLKEQTENSIEKLKKKSSKNKSRTGFANILALILSASITFSLGVESSGYESMQKNIALFLGALSTVLNGWLLLFDYKKLWGRQKRTLLRMYQLKNKIGYLESKENITEQDIDELFEEYLSIWEKDSADWELINRDVRKSKAPSLTQ